MKTYVYDFEGKSIRFVCLDRTLWVVAMDAANAMGYRPMGRPNHKLDQSFCRIIEDKKLLGHPYHNRAVVSIPGVFKLIFDCRFKKARRFGKWLYDLTTKDADFIKTVNELEGLIKANSAMVDVVSNYDGFDPLDQDIIDDNDSKLYNITDIGARLGVTARDLNKFLIDHHWIYKAGDTYYPTPLIQGRNYCIHRTYHKTNHTDIQHLKWTSRGKTAIINFYFKELEH